MNITSYLAPLQSWYNNLQTRERHIVTSGSIFLLITLFNLLLWEPVFNALETQKQQYQSQRQLLTWMKDAASEIRSLESSGASSPSRYNNQSVSSLVERSAISSGVKPFIRKLDASGNEVKAQLEKADFDRSIVWLNDLQQRYGINTKKIQIEPQNEPGTVNITVTLERAES